MFGPRADEDLSALPKDRVVVVQANKPDFDAFRDAGFDCAVDAAGDFAASVVFLPRAKALAKERIARAAAVAGMVIVDGQKTDGIDSLWKACRSRGDVGGTLTKAHGRIFWLSPGDFSDWMLQGETVVDGGFVTLPGVFSADGVDPASLSLAAMLPEKLGSRVADFGAGWGYLAARALERDAKIKEIHLVEADHVALECARRNVTDPRAEFHWADAITWQAPGRLDTVIMNPPFHSARAADPALGQAFIASAARALTPSGHLWLVANRHLPYEAALSASFVKCDEVGGDGRFKIFHAQRPTRASR